MSITHLRSSIVLLSGLFISAIKRIGDFSKKAYMFSAQKIQRTNDLLKVIWDKVLAKYRAVLHRIHEVWTKLTEAELYMGFLRRAGDFCSSRPRNWIGIMLLFAAIGLVKQYRWPPSFDSQSSLLIVWQTQSALVAFPVSLILLTAELSSRASAKPRFIALSRRVHLRALAVAAMTINLHLLLDAAFTTCISVVIAIDVVILSALVIALLVVFLRAINLLVDRIEAEKIAVAMLEEDFVGLLAEYERIIVCKESYDELISKCKHLSVDRLLGHSKGITEMRIPLSGFILGFNADRIRELDIFLDKLEQNGQHETDGKEQLFVLHLGFNVGEKVGNERPAIAFMDEADGRRPSRRLRRLIRRCFTIVPLERDPAHRMIRSTQYLANAFLDSSHLSSESAREAYEITEGLVRVYLRELGKRIENPRRGQLTSVKYDSSVGNFSTEWLVSSILGHVSRVVGTIDEPRFAQWLLHSAMTSIAWKSSQMRDFFLGVLRRLVMP